MLYILNALPNSYLSLISFTSSEPAQKQFRKLTEAEAIALLKEETFESAIGYKSTAVLLSNRLQTTIEENRITLEPSLNHKYLIGAFTPPRRLDKGDLYTEKEILSADLNYYLIY